MNDINRKKPASGSASPFDQTQSASAAVGYRNAPTQRQFKSGISGNPRGRPRGSKNRKTIVKEIAGETHAVRENGRRHRRSTLELVLLTLRNLALGGNVRAFRYYNKILAKYEPQVDASKGGYLVVPGVMSQEEWIKEAKRKNELMERYGVRNLAEVAEIERQEKHKNRSE